MKSGKTETGSAGAAAIVDRLAIVLVSTRNPLNIGAAARAMSNFGFRNLRVVNPHGLAFREARSAVGASALLKNAKEYNNLAEAIADCSLVVGTTAGRDRKLDHDLKLLPQAASRIRKRLSSARVALLFGSEKRGLSNRDLSWCHWLLRIPTREEHPSMNLGQAVAVCLFELSKQHRFEAESENRIGKGEVATSEDFDRLTTILLEDLQLCGYLKSPLSAYVEDKIRRFMRRSRLSHQDAQLWLGMLNQMKWKMTSKS
jgi:TrmH family RNA methyltransferase